MLCYERLCATEREKRTMSLRDFNSQMYRHIAEHVVPADSLTKVGWVALTFSAVSAWMYVSSVTLYKPHKHTHSLIHSLSLTHSLTH